MIRELFARLFLWLAVICLLQAVFALIGFILCAYTEHPSLDMFYLRTITRVGQGVGFWWLARFTENSKRT